MRSLLACDRFYLALTAVAPKVWAPDAPPLCRAPLRIIDAVGDLISDQFDAHDPVAH